MQKNRFDLVVAEIKAQAMNPPGKDIYLQSFYTHVLNNLDRDRSNQLIKIITETLTVRPKITHKHFVNLLFRSVQYLETNYLNNVNYPNGLETPEAWDKEINQLLENIEYEKHLRLTLKERNTTTTIYQRYCGPYFIMSTLTKNKVTFVDLGCGAGYGPLGISKSVPFKEIVDRTVGKKVAAQMRLPLPLNKAYGIDVTSHGDPESISWLRACQFYPSEIYQMNDILNFEKKVGFFNGKVTFFESDITNPKAIRNEFPKKKCDFATVCTTLYMIPDKKENVLKFAQGLLKPNGLVIVQDFARKTPNGKLRFDVSWTTGWPYRTFVWGKATGYKFWEVLKWSSGRCREVAPGDDFKAFLHLAS
ncbi:hypothetical protein A2872_01765 [Candidatus Gottesmanbacteria bacterium RIFCSPHIGHO2_01_FULL_42_12]|uniref:Methyltransferase domain-containing protein n=1 Tax=Candidatus Gottesmanbacteria bacterium RIFCSPHIGHO2_01_FULL_42_12 TaxID=1798377 RepID=A0A1F5Z679_9BACT|nr:MAG: hypothetical protein A2872_01765 [Candidatus Gottesmanbacteria bacterium RIFCSPHIGHO2_01_FULL_42_12]